MQQDITSSKTSYTRRFFAYALDQLFWGGALVLMEKTGLFSLPPFWEDVTGNVPLPTYRISLKLIALFWGSGWLYMALLESSPLQASIGKAILRLYVTDLRGQRVSFIRCMARQLSSLFILLELLLSCMERSLTGTRGHLFYSAHILPQDLFTHTQVIKKED